LEGKWNENTRNIAERGKDSQSGWRSNTCSKSGRREKTNGSIKERENIVSAKLGGKHSTQERKETG
jgi:hypothetical protein